jgi:hypothetical protein
MAGHTIHHLLLLADCDSDDHDVGCLMSAPGAPCTTYSICMV